MGRPRPTLRCLREDLALPLPTVDEPLDEVDHPLLAKTAEKFTDPETPHERIAAIDDNVLFKVKVQRWRGAVWVDDPRTWLVAAGWREAGSTDDFYAALSAQAIAARKTYNAEHAAPLKTIAYSDHLLPGPADERRYRAEAGARLLHRLSRAVHDLLRSSLIDGHEHTADMGSFRLGIQVGADHGNETYVAVRVTGSVPGNLIMLIFDYVPGCDRDGWYPEDAMPDRLLEPGEYVWSNIMDPSAAAKLLDIGDN
jgi:hypothetical protein